jgi:hypothetical protein
MSFDTQCSDGGASNRPRRSASRWAVPSIPQTHRARRRQARDHRIRNRVTCRDVRFDAPLTTPTPMSQTAVSGHLAHRWVCSGRTRRRQDVAVVLSIVGNRADNDSPMSVTTTTDGT